MFGLLMWNHLYASQRSWSRSFQVSAAAQSLGASAAVSFLSALSVSSCPRLRLLLYAYENRMQQLQPSIQLSSILFSRPCPRWSGPLWNLTEGALFLPLPIYMVNILEIQPPLSKLSLEDILSRRSPKTQRCPALTHVCTVIFPAAPHILQEECSLHTWLALPGKQNWFFSDTKDCHRWSLFVMFTDTQSNNLRLWEMRINTNSWPHFNDKSCSCCGRLAVIGWDYLLEQYLIFWFKWVAFTHSKMKTYSLLLRLL